MAFVATSSERPSADCATLTRMAVPSSTHARMARREDAHAEVGKVSEVRSGQVAEGGYRPRLRTCDQSPRSAARQFGPLSGIIASTVAPWRQHWRHGFN